MNSASLPPVLAARLGEEGTRQALRARQALHRAGVALPAWIDDRPGLLDVLVGDCASDPPLGQTARERLRAHGENLVAGLGLCALATAAPRVALLCPPDVDAGRLALGTRIEVHRARAAWPVLPERDVPRGEGRRALVLPVRTLDFLGASLLGRGPQLLCTVAGAVRRPQVLRREGGESPAELVRRCGGAEVTAWAAICSGAPGGRLWEADLPLPEETELLLILPVDHELVRGLRRKVGEWLPAAASLCLECRQCTEGCPAHLDPAALVHALASGAAAAEEIERARRCTGCGVCDALCPAGLAPLRAMTALRDAAGALPFDGEPRDIVRLPLSLLLEKLGLSRYA